MRLASLLLAALLAAGCAAPLSRGVAGKDVHDAAQALDTTVRRVLDRDGVARGDGYLYGLDVAWLMLYAARAGDRQLYDGLRPYADRLIVKGDPYTRGFVLWRQRPGTEYEIAGAGEGAAMARALLAGADSFGYARDRELAQQVLEGYHKLAFEKGMSWSVRRHFNFATRSFSDASFLSGYAPDLLAEARALQPAAAWPTPVDRSYAAIELASADNGLLRVVMLPELDETWADLPQRAFAPNNVTSLEESCLAAEGAVRGRPQVARGLLKFALDSGHTNFLGRLFGYFDVATGEPVGEALLTPIGYACLVRLAVAVGDTRAVAQLGGWFTRDLALIAGEPGVHPAPLYAAGPLLVAAQALKALPSRAERAAIPASNAAGTSRPRGENP
jgi:predicted small secreted protein